MDINTSCFGRRPILPLSFNLAPFVKHANYKLMLVAMLVVLQVEIEATGPQVTRKSQTRATSAQGMRAGQGRGKEHLRLPVNK